MTIFFISKNLVILFYFLFFLFFFNHVNQVLFYAGFHSVLLFVVTVLPILLLAATTELWNYRRDGDHYVVNGNGKNSETTLYKR